MHVVSVSTGKDSSATLALCLETQDRAFIRAVSADTGNEHEEFHAYLDYLEDALHIPIDRLRRDFTPEWQHRMAWLRSDEPYKATARRTAYTREEVQRCLTVFEEGPTGNPYLDLCIIKGRFPSRKAQFCTEFLKTDPLVEYQMQWIDRGYDVWSWQGVRMNESASRLNRHRGSGACVLGGFEVVGGGLFINRPILRWTSMDSIEAMLAYGIKPNPLYSQGCDRVGCMPCIHVGKVELLNVAKRWPQHIDRIAKWERVVALASKRGLASFFPSPDDGRGALQGRSVAARVQWSKTSRGGRQVRLDADEPVKECSSSYGLCE